MKPFDRMAIGILTGAAVGFTTAWQLKPAVGNPESTADTPLSTRVERRPTTPHPLGKPAPSAFSLRWEELGNDDDCEEKREALLANLGADEFPQLLAEIDAKAGLSGLDNPGDNQLRELFHAWHAKAPDAAMDWLRALPKAADRQRLLYEIVDEIAETSPDDAIVMLRQDGRDEDGHMFIPDKLLETAASQGEDKLLEVCRVGLDQAGKWSSPCEIKYPDGFDFKHVLNGLAEAQGSRDERFAFASVPSNLLSEWAKKDLQGALAWLREGKQVPYNHSRNLIDATPTAEAGAVLAAIFEPAAPAEKRYEDSMTSLYSRPAPEFLDGFLQALPGERAVHLDGLFDELGSSANFGELHALLLERMSLEQRREALRRNCKDGVYSRNRPPLIRVLQALGHSEEEIQSLLPERKD